MSTWWKKGGKGAAPAAAAGESADVAQAFAAGLRQHQTGRLVEATNSYTQVLAHAPRHFEALHMLGVIALQQGRMQEALDQIARAIAVDARQAAAHSNLGIALLRSDRLAQARAAFETAVQLNPRDANACANLGTVLMKLGDADAATVNFRRALSAGGSPELRNELAAALLQTGDPQGAARELQGLLRTHPTHAAAHNNLGIALERTGDLKRALQEFERAAALKPDFVDPRINLASLRQKTGKADEARRGLEEVIRRHPGAASAHANLGALLRDEGLPEQALLSLRQALAIDPLLLEARLNLAGVLLQTGQVQAAQSTIEGLVMDQPRSPDARVLLAQSRLAQGQLGDAEASLRLALELHPRHAEAHHVLGLVRMACGDAAGARASHEHAVALDPHHAPARWAAVMARVSSFVESDAEVEADVAAFAQGLRELDRWFDASRAALGHAAVGSTQPFYIAYRPGNHGHVLAQYGMLCSRLMQAWRGIRPCPPAQPLQGRKIRLGIVSAQVRDHSVWTAILRGWVQQLDTQRFEVHLFSLGTGVDAQTATARTLVAHFQCGPAGLAQWQDRILDAAPDVLIYSEIGMDAMAVKLASLRLAPLQLATWGHPMTTGLPLVDSYLSAEAFEPPDAQAHYTEELVSLPGLGVHYPPLNVKSPRIDRKALGLPDRSPLLICPGLPFKYAPADDHVWLDIAQRAPAARLVFFNAGPPELHERLRLRLTLAFAARGLDINQHASWLPIQGRPEFFALMRDACLFLDTLGFSGFNTAMQAVECELPIITMEGSALRSRFGSGILHELGLDECVASDKAAYVDKVVALVNDNGKRLAVQAHMRRHADRVFSTTAPVRALERFIENRLMQLHAANRTPPGPPHDTSLPADPRRPGDHAANGSRPRPHIA